MNNKQSILDALRAIGLDYYESRLYLELLHGPATHQKLAHATSINRTKVYRLAEDLEKRSLITRRTDDRGTFLVASDPGTLEVAIVNQEQRIEQGREALQSVLPLLNSLQAHDGREFIVNTYEGTDGFKQMLWHELRSKGDLLIFENGDVDDLVDDERWAEKHRSMTVAAGYRTRVIGNPSGINSNFTNNDDFMASYQRRALRPEILAIEHPIVVYNDTVATYHWREGQKVGFEVINRAYADMMRQVFENYWKMVEASPSA